MQHIKMDITKCVFVSVHWRLWKAPKRDLRESWGSGLPQKNECGAVPVCVLWEQDQPSPTQVIQRDSFPTRKSHESRTACRACLCETQCTEPSIGFVTVHPGGFALRGHSEHLQ